MEKAHILRVLEACSWNQTRAAEILDIDRVTLHHKLKKYGWSKPDRRNPMKRAATASDREPGRRAAARDLGPALAECFACALRGRRPAAWIPRSPFIASASSTTLRKFSTRMQDIVTSPTPGACWA